jgi:hypothetical protein
MTIMANDKMMTQISVKDGFIAALDQSGGSTANVTGPLDVVANFLVVRTMKDGEMMIFGAGRYVDRIKRDAGTWKFASKTVVLDSRQIDTLLAIPI